MQDESSPHYAGAVCALSGANDQDALRRLRRLLASHSALSRNAYAALYWGLAEGLQLDHGASEEVFARAMQWVEARLTQLNQ